MECQLRGMLIPTMLLLSAMITIMCGVWSRPTLGMNSSHFGNVRLLIQVCNETNED